VNSTEDSQYLAGEPSRGRQREARTVQSLLNVDESDIALVVAWANGGPQ
jgi:hypothetical protein